MSNESPTPQFTNTREDLSHLKQTALEAADNLSNTARAHVSKAQGHLRDLAGHVQEDSQQQLEHVKDKVSDLANAARDYAKERPFMVIGAALALGFFVGLSRRRTVQS